MAHPPVIGIDFGATYTKIAFRRGFSCGPELEEESSESLGQGEEALIPSLAIETGRPDTPWVFGQIAAEMKPGGTITVHHNWKSKLINPDGYEPDAKTLEIAVQFFRWLRTHLVDSNVIPFLIEDATVRLCVPAFDNSGEILMRISVAMEEAGWNNRLLLKTSEPKANTIGYCTRGKNIRLRTGQPDWGDMFDQTSALMIFTNQHARFGFPDNESATLAILDIGSFTSDLSLIDWSSGQTEDYLSDGKQISFRHGIVDNLDEVCLSNVLPEGVRLDDLDFFERELIKKRLYSENKAYEDSGIGIGGEEADRIVELAIDYFCQQLIELLKPQVTSKRIRWFILTGGGSNIPRIAKKLSNYFEGLAGNGVTPLQLNGNDGNGNRLDTAIGATSLILDLSAGKTTQPTIAPAGPEPLPPLENCSCHANPGCLRCCGSGIIKPRLEPIRMPRIPIQVLTPPELEGLIPDEFDETNFPLGAVTSDHEANETAPHTHVSFTTKQIQAHTLEGWMGGLVFPNHERKYSAFKETLCSQDTRKRNASWYRLLCLACSLGAKVPRSVIKEFWNSTLDRTHFWEITTGDNPNQTKLDRFFEDLIHREFGNGFALGEQADLLRRVFYDFRKLHHLVYQNKFAEVILEVLSDADGRSNPVNFLRSGWLPDQARWRGVIGQSMTSPLLFLMREWRRMELITTDRFDHQCFYMNSPARRAACKRGWLAWDRYYAGDLPAVLDASQTAYDLVIRDEPWPLLDFDIPLQILGSRK